ncbi:hypothetical protein ARMGADRAFT_1021486 [Armillaria gallica]|uniref:Uncharacterized protein n=1 Tax=Armillaria gallica TaxID=47427 RepID=A0A2H3CM74_ARMGA|nr:hypothetical protein ARMGADRAFT_1021486 [Armillaria gallica]
MIAKPRTLLHVAISVEFLKWKDRLYKDVPPEPEWDSSVDEATRQAREEGYMAKVNAATKDVLEEYTKWRANNDEALDESR